MKVVYKYALSIECSGAHCLIDLPIGAKILKVEMQGRRFFLWALVGLDEIRTEQRHFFMLNTDQGSKEEQYDHIATIFDGGFVWHIFEGRRQHNGRVSQDSDGFPARSGN